ncbi:hypothetical protein BKH43_00270 [Helicobacter sp. 13S00401-1]|uniref:prepilin peptidase n=1 Tax=Helicobacter sp. 13S00401-1 TaxID=1905758 RepID=UPI000BA7AB08|nr:prepilin peptidase [Helicobacter sp. 13S00401-1]PAF51712.1 hypothetical protein BKH43_00270 [Helicobacter sp. 13S00401-1]
MIIYISIFACILAYISYTDIRFRTIGNIEVVLCLVMVLLGHLIFGLKLNFIALAISFAIGLVVYKLGFMAAGDVKLFSVLVLLVKSEFIGGFLLIMSLIGALLAIIIIIFNRKKDGVPYGVAIAISFFTVLIYT